MGCNLFNNESINLKAEHPFESRLMICAGTEISIIWLWFYVKLPLEPQGLRSDNFILSS